MTRRFAYLWFQDRPVELFGRNVEDGFSRYLAMQDYLWLNLLRTDASFEEYRLPAECLYWEARAAFREAESDRVISL